MEFIDLGLNETDIRQHALHSAKTREREREKSYISAPNFCFFFSLVKNPTKGYKNSQTKILKILLFVSDWRFHIQMFILVYTSVSNNYPNALRNFRNCCEITCIVQFNFTVYVGSLYNN
jgi:hypothetical protein